MTKITCCVSDSMAAASKEGFALDDPARKGSNSGRETGGSQ